MEVKEYIPILRKLLWKSMNYPEIFKKDIPVWLYIDFPNNITLGIVNKQEGLRYIIKENYEDRFTRNFDITETAKLLEKANISNKNLAHFYTRAIKESAREIKNIRFSKYQPSRLSKLESELLS